MSENVLKLYGRHLEAVLSFCFALQENSSEVENSMVQEYALVPHRGFRIRDCDSHQRVFEEEGVHKGGASCLSPTTH